MYLCIYGSRYNIGDSFKMQKLFNAYSIISVVISVGTQTDEEYINQGKCMIQCQ